MAQKTLYCSKVLNSSVFLLAQSDLALVVIFYKTALMWNPFRRRIRCAKLRLVALCSAQNLEAAVKLKRLSKDLIAACVSKRNAD